MWTWKTKFYTQFIYKWALTIIPLRTSLKTNIAVIISCDAAKIQTVSTVLYLDYVFRIGTVSLHNKCSIRSEKVSPLTLNYLCLLSKSDKGRGSNREDAIDVQTLVVKAFAFITHYSGLYPSACMRISFDMWNCIVGQKDLPGYVHTVLIENYLF